ncbi:MAG: hypothetical protein COV10_02805 [Candidatus Vogelbacteria bacterium CG10_big_fil_rev_8_21_14_0_10_51_16]|uniref:Penicillin-binding protein transpeptidase domain-containing protein n=1 Tax=Candidatus Vogelbacteria bacterium CG10_big_fil_rev_8_21_14_0_10_51_16 TaxID=1975045 RepID=A0A2H0RE23_9BACT|nr:MAG: hypothetical protein COV10_02805 [Candidatus Vogelbacteria bacterium CG10_big_fil_rev_8_21_14_0_10_51_16]
MRSHSLIRLRIISAILLLVALLCLGQLFNLQVLNGLAYAEQADRQYVTTTADNFKRGTIFFREKSGELIAAATLRPVYYVAIDPSRIQEPDDSYQKLSAVLRSDQVSEKDQEGSGFTRELFLAQATKPDDSYEVIARDLPEHLALAISELGLAGVTVHRQKQRYYPGGTMAAHLLGFVGWGKSGGVDTLAGRYGLERYFEDALSRSATNLYVNFFAQVFAGLGSFVNEEQPTEGDIVSSIEPTVQGTLEEQIEGLQKKWQAKEVGAIVMDPRTGRIIAMAAVPTYNPNLFSKVKDQALFTNPLVEKVYEFGSIVKPIALAAALDMGAVSPATTYVDTGSVKVGQATISNFDGRARGLVNMQEVLNQSLNVGMVFVMQSMGRKEFAEGMRRYGIDEKTGIDLPGEVASLTANLNSKRDVEHATSAFGQGIALTPIAMARALAVLANGGKLVQPHVVEEIRYVGGVVDRTTPEPLLRAIKQETADTITDMLVNVVDVALAGGTKKMEHYKIAAKTGTAQIPEPRGGYYDDRFSHSFFGYFPASNPEFLVFYYMMQPEGARYASETLTDPFMQMTRFLLSYYQVPPDR